LLRKYPDDWPEAEFWAFESAPGVGDVGPDDNYLSFSAVLLTTASRGNMTIRSANIRDPPVISPNWLTDERDVEQAYGVLQRLREIMSKADIVESEVLPGPEIASKKDMIQWLRDNMTYIFHGSSTCKLHSSSLFLSSSPY
jgi:choline dehydrogenase